MTSDGNNPFESRASSRSRWIKAGSFLLVAVATGVAVLRWSGHEQARVASGHDMSAMAPGGADSPGTPVALTPTEQQRIGVTFAPVSAGELLRTVRVVGLVKEDETRIRTFTSRVDGFVEELSADFTGQLVRAGDRLLGLYSPELVAAQTELLLALDLERSVGRQNAEARASASSGVAAARRRLSLWNVPEDVLARVERTGQTERVIPLRSPFGGFIVDKQVLLGQRIMAGDALYRIADLSVVWVEGEVFEQDLPLVRVGLAVTATFQALPGDERRGRVTYIYPTVDPSTRTARVRVALDNPGLRLKPGMYGQLQWEGLLTDGLTVPRSAIVATGTRNLVFVKLADGRFEPREVVLGVATPDRIQVLRGLARGDTVVASGTFLVDAESNLGSLLGGMGDMPGMDMSAPKPVHADHEKE
jgi:Cu(I)/Ag(I) efflux system membrane fusion protein